MTTEAEAKTLMCCGPLGVGSNQYAHFPEDTVSSLTGCVGSKCMAWRWATGPDPVEPEEPGPEQTSDPPTDPDREGFCGLAGKP